MQEFHIPATHLRSDLQELSPKDDAEQLVFPRMMRKHLRDAAVALKIEEQRIGTH